MEDIMKVAKTAGLKPSTARRIADHVRSTVSSLL